MAAAAVTAATTNANSNKSTLFFISAPISEFDELRVSPSRNMRNSGPTGRPVDSAGHPRAIFNRAIERGNLAG
jgi:hypothetical protein